MEPIGPLMHEHRLIERMIRLMDDEAARIEAGQRPDLNFIYATVEFIRTYADRCHHGKEEDILFKELETKSLRAEHQKILKELIEEHIYGRQLVAELLERTVALEAGGDGRAVAETMRKITAFYPAHIQKEDKGFFYPILEYFNRTERDRMIANYELFERRLLHERYAEYVEGWEKRRSGS